MYGRHQISSTASSGFISRPGPSHAQPLLHSNNASPGPSSSWQFQLEASQIESLIFLKMMPGVPLPIMALLTEQQMLSVQMNQMK